MPSYAILGGSGNTGRELIEHLMKSDDTTLHIYVRSRSKLLKLHPELGSAGSRHQIFEGDLTDVKLFTKCITGTEVVFSVVGTNANNPAIRLSQDSATVIITALSKLKSDTKPADFKCPTVVFLTSAGMTSDPRVRANFPNYLHRMIQVVGKYIYEDFRRGTAMFNKPENAWIDVIFFCAPGLMPGKSQGKVKVGVDIPKKAPTYVTYTDLASGMIQSAHEPSLLHKEIGIVGARMPPVEYGTMLFLFVTGIMCVWAPPLWRIGYRRGWWGY